MAKFSVPGIRFTEIDNTVRSNSTAQVGVGAIVMKSNKGPVNQRILTSSYDHFTQLYGEPENLDDYGHFAAENYLAISNQLLTVRATMGDEQYAQIQYPYTDAEANFKYKSKDIACFKFINNEDQSNLQLLSPLTAVTVLDSLITNPIDSVHPAWVSADDSFNAPFYVNQRAQCVTINDLISDAAPQVAVFKTNQNNSMFNSSDLSNIIKASGTYVQFVSNVGKDGSVTRVFDDLIFKKDVWDGEGPLPSAMFNIPSTGYSDDKHESITGYKVSVTVPASATLNDSNVSISMWLNQTGVAAIRNGEATWQKLFTDKSEATTWWYKAVSTTATEVPSYVTATSAVKLQFLDWDDCNNKTYYVETTAGDTVAQALAISYREYGMAEKSEALIINSNESSNLKSYNYECKPASAYVTSEKEADVEFIHDLADEYGIEVTELNNDRYAVLQYSDVFAGVETDTALMDADVKENRICKIIYAADWDPKSVESVNDKLFWVYSKKDSGVTTTISTYTATPPTQVTIPWQDGMIKEDIVGDAEANPKLKQAITKMTAYPTSEILNSTNDAYKDGYTMTIESDEEPGNGDIEQYVSNKENQLIIAAIGPGKFGNDIGVSIITTECANIPALNHQNAFNWKYKYDDEELVDKDDPDTDFTWKKVYRINVYAKLKTQTAEAAWGTGMEALLKDPIEFFYVSNDPQAKDGEGNSLFAPNVINGHSDYIYVSRQSVNDAMTGNGQYAQPEQTYAIYGLTGGANSKKNNMSEKTAALKLYTDRQKANFDILFNVEAVDSFNGRQRYAAHQRRIAEIAAARTMDIGVVQITSKESKTVKRMLSEGKAFAFSNGTYVAPYGGYDKYYNNTLASWIYLPKSVAGACSMAYCDTRSYPWMAPAGTTRGVINYTANQLSRLSDAEIGQLYDNNINTSRLCGAYGEVLWGQKTALKKDSALNRINVRRCLNYIEKVLENMMTPYLFQQNTENTRSAARNVIDAFLGRVKAAEGIVDYSLSVTEDPEDEHIMLVNISVIPAETIEFIDVKITVNRKSVELTESTR